MTMTAWKMPPKAKIYEALSALADGRVRIKGPKAGMQRRPDEPV